MKRNNADRQGGYAVIELLITLAVLVVAAQALMFFIKQMSMSAVDYRKRTYAMEKAVQMLEELRALVYVEGQVVSVLDNYRDGWESGTNIPYYKYTLTTKRSVTHDAVGNTLPDWQQAVAPLSSNPISSKGYEFVRHVEISKDPDDPTVRKVIVRVFEASPKDRNGQPNRGNAAASVAMAADPRTPLAEVYSVVRSFGTESPPSQVMDVYLVALESVPGWWARTSRLQALMQNTIISLQARNPGLRIREHWITRMSYGRDLEYTPETNPAGTVADSYSFAKTYIYPTLITYDNGVDEYYALNWFRSRLNVAGTIVENDGYAIADQFNHAMRYPDEERMYALHKQIAVANGNAEPEYSLRMLLEKMNNNDPALRNSIIINLHGEMVPVLPIRNYSDPAKDPAYYWNERPALFPGKQPRAFRAVTHPEQLHFVTGSAEVALRVYAWDANTPPDPISPALENDTIDVVTIFIPDANLSHLQQVERLQGSSTVPYHWHKLSATTWVNGGTYISDVASPTTSTAQFIADDYTTPDGRSGLRIRLFGVSATARAYNGPAYVGP